MKTDLQSGKCLNPEALARAFSSELSSELRAHLDGCAACAREWAALSRLRQFSQSLPAERIAPERADAVRARLLYEAERLRQDAGQRTGRGHRRGQLAVAAGVLALAVAAIPLGLRLYGRTESSATDAPGPTAHITPSGDARFTPSDSTSDAVVRLFDGTLQLSVAPLRRDHRFRVKTGDAEVEVRGTAFVVTAAQDCLQRVSVEHGLVEVRPQRSASVLLSAGQQWSAPPPDHTAARQQAAPPRPSKGSEAEPRFAAHQPAPMKGHSITAPAANTGRESPAQRPPPASFPSGGREEPAHQGPPAAPSPARSEAEQAFAAGFAALKQGRFLAAAPEFERTLQLAPKSALAEDARFWSGVAWARAGRSQEAVKTLRAFLSQYPSSQRSGEAAAALGWLLLRAHNLDEAEQVFKLAEQDRNPQVKESARAGLLSTAAARAKK